MYIYIYIYILYIDVIMKTMCYLPVYHHYGFYNISLTFIKIKPNREIVGNISPNMKLTPPCIPLPDN